MSRMPLADVRWLSAFQPRRSDPDLRPLPLGMLGLIVIGALLLMLPGMTAPGRTLAWLDAFFVATSAVCVTGLSTVNPGETFSPLGLGVVIALVQLGGLGIVTASLALVMLSGERLSLAHEGAVAATLGRLQRARPGELFGYSCAVVAVSELAGAVVLFVRLCEVNPTADPGELAWVAVFHAVSAFCNAGFSTFPEGLVRWRDDPWLLGAVDLLVFAGGIGLMALVSLRYFHFWRRDPRQRGQLALQTKLALAVSLLLVLAGLGATLLFEWNRAFAAEPWSQKISLAAFHSFMRTAGFTATDLAEMHPATLLFSLGLMFIGGSPGSMAGGIKTVTFAILFCTARAALLRQENVQIFGRRLDPRISAIALMIMLLALAGTTAGIAALMITEIGQPASATSHHWLGLAFEAVSAFGTVGFSTGVTPLLTPGGKIVIMILMFVGRVGPLMLAVYLVRPVKPWRVRFPEEDVALG
ncbi:MAG: potassium transporter TrkG [Opitutaceae bacterium]|nr:potassium transporter TrkG [Opitutaceae bacterium]